jgi:hypothetical protein
MRTGLDDNIQATREYQHTNRRVTNITLHPRFTSCSSQLVRIDEKFEEEVPLPVDNISAISDADAQPRAAKGVRMKAERDRRVG